MNIELTYPSFVSAKEVAKQAMQTIIDRMDAGRKKPRYDLPNRPIDFMDIPDGLQIRFYGIVKKMRIKVEDCQSRLKNERRQWIIRKSRKGGAFARVIFIYAKQCVESVVHKLLDCIKSYFNASRRRHDRRVHVYRLRHQW